MSFLAFYHQTVYGEYENGHKPDSKKKQDSEGDIVFLHMVHKTINLVAEKQVKD